MASADTPGREFSLRSRNISSIGIGSPTSFRQLQAGQITSYALDPDGKGITLNVLINAPFDKYVADDTRFLNAISMDAKQDAYGIDFEILPESGNAMPAAAKNRFTLFPAYLQAMKTPEVDGDKFFMTFNESVRGLDSKSP